MFRRHPCLVILFPALLTAGCSGTAATQPLAVENRSQIPSEIELSEPKVTLVEPTRVEFEIKYRFTKGRPDKNYSCEIFFPGTPNHAVRLMESWELKPEGTIRDGVVLTNPPVTTFDIHMSEAPTARERYTKVSNVLSGPVKSN